MGPGHLSAPQDLEMAKVEDGEITLVAKLERERKQEAEKGTAESFPFYFLHVPRVPSLTFRLEVLPTHAPRFKISLGEP